MGTSRRQRRWRPWMTWVAGSIGGLLCLLLVTAAYYYPKLKPIVDQARTAQQAAKQLNRNISQQDFTAAKENVQTLEDTVDRIKQQLNQARGLAKWPYLGRQYRAGENLITVGQHSTVALSSLVDFMAHLFEPFADRGKISLATISPAEKGLILANIAGQEDDLKAAQDSIHQAQRALDLVPDRGLLPPLQRVVAPVKQQFPLITQALDQAIPATHLLPPILGFPTAKQYLFLLQNNTELRPSGGFIGTYGLMRVNSGEIVSLKTDNSYNLDEAAKNLPIIEPPAPIKQYLKQSTWYFRDANWSPDFPTSAEQALLLYQREGGTRNIDGVLAMTPTTIIALLRLVGPITIDKIEFNAENFTDRLQQYVDVGYKSSGQTDDQRKDIIGRMTKDLVDRLMKLPIAQWKDVFLVMSQQLNQKQLLMYMKDQATQSILIEQHWAGAIDRAPESDSLLIVDANLASLKTDSVMERHYQYRVRPDGDRLLAELTIQYRHTGKFDWRTSWKISRYNTYLRVYVPGGSELVNSTGAQLREKSNAPGQVTTSTELGKTVFAAFKSIEPGTSSEFTVSYRLPADISAQLSKGQYRLAWQKQPGMIKPTIDLAVTVPTRPLTVDGLDSEAKLSQSAFSFIGGLDQDRLITATVTTL